MLDDQLEYPLQEHGVSVFLHRVVDEVDDEADEFVLDALEEVHRVRIVGIERVAVDARFTAQFRGRDLFDGLAPHEFEQCGFQSHFRFDDASVSFQCRHSR